MRNSRKTCSARTSPTTPRSMPPSQHGKSGSRPSQCRRTGKARRIADGGSRSRQHSLASTSSALRRVFPAARHPGLCPGLGGYDGRTHRYRRRSRGSSRPHSIAESITVAAQALGLGLNVASHSASQAVPTRSSQLRRRVHRQPHDPRQRHRQHGVSAHDGAITLGYFSDANGNTPASPRNTSTVASH